MESLSISYHQSAMHQYLSSIQLTSPLSSPNIILRMRPRSILNMTNNIVSTLVLKTPHPAEPRRQSSMDNGVFGWAVLVDGDAAEDGKAASGIDFFGGNVFDDFAEGGEGEVFGVDVAVGDFESCINVSIPIGLCRDVG